MMGEIYKQNYIWRNKALPLSKSQYKVYFRGHDMIKYISKCKRFPMTDRIDYVSYKIILGLKFIPVLLST